MASINNKSAGAGFGGGGGGGGGGGVTSLAGNGIGVSAPTGAVTLTASPFAPAGFANVSTFNAWNDLAVSPDGKYVYVTGVLTSNSHGAIAQVSIASGLVVATCDLGAGVSPQGIAVSPDSAAIYAYDKTAGLTWWKIATSAMTITHTSTLAVAVATTSAQQFDLSPDGTVYAYVSGADVKVYKIDTTTYAVTNVTVGHSGAGAFASAVCWYNGSSANFYVAYAATADVDLYSAGVYTSTVSTGAGGTPAFKAMRSGINGNFFIADNGTNKSAIAVRSGTPTIYPLPGNTVAIAVNTLSQAAIVDGADDCVIACGGTICDFFEVSSFAPIGLVGIPTPYSINQDGFWGLALSPDSSERLFFLSGADYPEVWSLPSVIANPPANTAGNIQTSDGVGNWASAAPYSTSGWSGTGVTLSGGGTATVTTPVATTTSIILVSSTGTGNLVPPAVTTKNNGSFIVTGTAAATFDWVILSP
jgi:hypothetical protein